MLELSNDDIPQVEAAMASRTKPVGFVILALAALLSWFPLIL
jgi:hypothetical protein